MKANNSIQLITYPDSLGQNLSELNELLCGALQGLFAGVHILPPFPSSGDRGFAPISYFEIDSRFGTWPSISEIGKTHDVVLDLMVNHISRQSEYFQDYLEQGEYSRYKDLFITMDKVWADGVPVQADIDRIFLRRKLPYSDFETGGGTSVRLWTTFGKTDPSEQIDVDVHSEAAKALFRRILSNFSDNGVRIVRLDAVGYVIKKPGTSCFFVEPEIYEFLDWIMDTAKEYGLELLPEVHSHYSIQNKLAARGYWIYDFILPYRVLEALILQKADMLGAYLKERPEKQFTTLDCHDGVPVIPDMNDLLDVENAKYVAEVCKSRGSNFSKVYSEAHQLEGGFDVHQIRGTFYSMLNENDDDYIKARAIQLFTPGVPQIYYVGLLAGVNKLDRAEVYGDGREINRYNYTVQEVAAECKREVVQRLFRLMRFRNEHPSFGGTFTLEKAEGSELVMKWENGDQSSVLSINLSKPDAYVEYSEGENIYRFCI